MGEARRRGTLEQRIAEGVVKRKERERVAQRERIARQRARRIAAHSNYGKLGDAGRSASHRIRGMHMVAIATLATSGIFIE